MWGDMLGDWADGHRVRLSWDTLDNWGDLVRSRWGCSKGTGIGNNVEMNSRDSRALDFQLSDWRYLYRVAVLDILRSVAEINHKKSSSSKSNIREIFGLINCSNFFNPQ
jgi:hypothetical protein